MSGCRCDECRKAQRDYMRDYYAGRGKATMQAHAAARNAATTRLVAMYPDDFRRLYESEKAARGL